MKLIFDLSNCSSQRKFLVIVDMLSSEALKPVEVHFIKASAKDRDLKGSNGSITFSMTRSDSQDKFTEVDSLVHPPQVRLQKLGAGVARSHFSVRLALRSKSSFQNRTRKRPDALLGGISSHHMHEGGGQSDLTEMDLLLNLNLSGEHCLLRNDHKLFQERPRQDFRLYHYHQQNLDVPIWYSSKVEQMLQVPEILRGQAQGRFYSPPGWTLGSRRKKLLILDINGLLADIVSPPPREYKADIKIARRAGENDIKISFSCWILSDSCITCFIFDQVASFSFQETILSGLYEVLF